MTDTATNFLEVIDEVRTHRIRHSVERLPEGFAIVAGSARFEFTGRSDAGWTLPTAESTETVVDALRAGAAGVVQASATELIRTIRQRGYRVAKLTLRSTVDELETLQLTVERAELPGRRGHAVLVARDRRGEILASVVSGLTARPSELHLFDGGVTADPRTDAAWAAATTDLAAAALPVLHRFVGSPSEARLLAAILVVEGTAVDANAAFPD